jgi:hypothetical protein
MGADCRGGAATVQRVEEQVMGEKRACVGGLSFNFLRGVSFLAPFLLSTVSLFYVFMLMSLLFSVAAFCLLASDYHIRDIELLKKAKRECPDSVRTRLINGINGIIKSGRWKSARVLAKTKNVLSQEQPESLT